MFGTAKRVAEPSGASTPVGTHQSPRPELSVYA